MTQIDENLFGEILGAATASQVEAVLGKLPVVGPEDYQYVSNDKVFGSWRDGHLHWLPVGRDRGNGGRIKLAGKPTNPIAERLVNGMEALIELARLRELARDPNAPMPNSPREAVHRYFGLPNLDSIPRTKDTAKRRTLTEKINEARKGLEVRLLYEKKDKEFTVAIRDQGMGQEPGGIHSTLLSLGQTDKADKPYMIGVFGQGGSSAYAASEYSTIISRRAPDRVAPGGDDGVGWTVVQQIHPKGRRDPYFAYLAASEDGSVPRCPPEVAEAVGFTHGCRFAHVDYDFGGSSAAVARMLYQALNHVLFSPMLPYDLYAMKPERPDLMQGTAQRLARQAMKLGRQGTVDKSFAAQPVGGAA